MQEIDSFGICLDAPSVMMSIRCEETLHHCQAHVRISYRICFFDPDLSGEYSATSQSLIIFLNNQTLFLHLQLYIL